LTHIDFTAQKFMALRFEKRTFLGRLKVATRLPSGHAIYSGIAVTGHNQPDARKHGGPGCDFFSFVFGL
jgi:hypothetical protein